MQACRAVSRTLLLTVRNAHPSQTTVRSLSFAQRLSSRESLKRISSRIPFIAWQQHIVGASLNRATIYFPDKCDIEGKFRSLSAAMGNASQTIISRARQDHYALIILLIAVMYRGAPPHTYLILFTVYFPLA